MPSFSSISAPSATLIVVDSLLVRATALSEFAPTTVHLLAHVNLEFEI